MRPDAELMALALAAAARGEGRTHPNPAVGCVVARAGVPIAVGHHRRAGGPHAEAVALTRAGARARGADVFVTLEPCAHQGRTGPCAQALIAAGVARVVIATRDPNPRVDGRGIRRLRAAGIRVEVGLLGAPCRRLNLPFASMMRRGRPWVTAKLAQSLDGRTASRTGASQWITGPAARRAGHALRNVHDAILVGRGTVVCDDPRLTCRLRGGRDPTRVVLDSAARLPPGAAVLRVAATSRAPTLVCVTERAPAARVRRLRAAGAEVAVCGPGAQVSPAAALGALGARGLMSVLVEGGGGVLGAFFDAGLVDRVAAFVAPLVLGGVDARSGVGGLGALAPAAAVRLTGGLWRQVGGDWLFVADVDRRRASAAGGGAAAGRPHRGRAPAAPEG